MTADHPTTRAAAGTVTRARRIVARRIRAEATVAAVGTDLMRRLEVMLGELQGNQLQVCLAPSKRKLNETDMIRVPLSRNAKWYRDFCSRFPSTRVRVHRKHDTLIKRQHTIKALERMIAGSRRGVYEERILAILK